MQAVEPVARRWLRLHRHVVRQHRCAGRLHVAARGVHRAAGGAVDAGCRRFLLAVLVRRLQALRARRMPGSCPTGAIIRTEFDSVYVQPDICNGCGYCVINCPFGVIDRREDDGRAWKCTLCYDRLKEDMEPACAKACPTDSIKFGDLEELRQIARERVEQLHEKGMHEAYLYGADAAQPARHRGLECVLSAGGQARGVQPAARSGGADEER